MSLLPPGGNGTIMRTGFGRRPLPRPEQTRGSASVATIIPVSAGFKK